MIFSFRIGVVEVKVIVLNVLGDSVYLELGVVNLDLGVEHCHHINLTTLRLLFEEGSLPHANTDAHLRAANVVKSGLHLCATLINKYVKVDVYVATTCSVLGIAVCLGLLLFLKCQAALGTFGLHLLDVVHNVARARLVFLLHGRFFSDRFLAI